MDENLKKQWDLNRKKEKGILKKRSNAKENFINKKVAGKVPENLEETLNAAFAKAFEIIFEKGTQYVEKTYNKEQMVNNYKNTDRDSIEERDVPFELFNIKAENYGVLHTILSGAAGTGMGALGVGIPDIPVFIGMLLRGIYQIALNYGYSYETKEEKIWILMLIKGGLLRGSELMDINREINLWIQHKETKVPNLEDQIGDTSMAFSKELLYSKFLQGIPVVGAVGGFYDAVYMNQITEYAQLKYELRFLYDRKE